MLEFALYKCGELIVYKKERDEKYPHICRTDLQAWKRWKLYPFAATLLCTRIFLILIPCLLFYFVFGSIIGMGLKPGDKVSSFRRAWTKVFTVGLSGTLNIASGVWYTRKHVDFDYSYYLGPKWREELNARKKRAPTVISTHSSILDSFNCHVKESFTIVARSNLARVPGIG
jgi:1-acyl-sn-glycerol-3-phosphate acyltransferase